MPARHRFSARMALWLVLALAGCLAGYSVLAPTPLDRARRLTSAAVMDVRPPSSDWVSDHELFVWTKEVDEEKVPALFDIRSGKMTVLRALDREFRRLQASAYDGNWRPSPVGRKLVAVTREETGNTLLCSLDGKVERMSTEFQSPTWLPDGSGWVEPEGDSGMKYHFLAQAASASGKSGASRVLPTTVVGDPPKTCLAALILAEPMCTKDNRYLAMMPEVGAEQKFMALAEAKLDTRPIQIKAWRIPLPSGPAGYETSISPDGRRIAWIARVGRRPTRTLWDRVRASIYPRAANQPYGEICVTDIDGTNTRRLGSYEIGARGGTPHFMRWTPDGKNLLFERNLALWIVPVD